MRKVAIVMLSAGVAAGFGFAAAPGGATVAAKNTRFCRAVSQFGSLSAGLTSGSLSPDEAGTIAKALRKAGKTTPRKVRNAMNRLARIYDRVANGDTFAQVLRDDITALTEAGATFGMYYAQQCANVSIPTT